MIETDFYILSEEQFAQFSQLAEEINVSIDYYLCEFCDVSGPLIEV
jgi:hypothetical protein